MKTYSYMRGDVMKRKLLSALCLSFVLLSLTACNAEDINKAINQAGSQMGVELNANIKQEDIDAVMDKAGEIKDGVVNVVTDEEVQSAAGNLLDAIKGANAE